MYVKSRRMSRAESQARTRQLLLESAADAFVERGYNTATIEEISENAGFSRGAFYANFADKSEIFLAIVEDQQQRDFNELAERIESTPDTKILDLMYEWFTRTLVHAPLRRALNEFKLAAQDQPSLRKRLAALDSADVDLSARMLADYCQRSQATLQVPPEAFAGMVTALIGGYANRLAINPKGVNPKEIGLALETLWTALSTQPPPPSEGVV
jgi:AcrR family transcriptional regulator